jgi:hypothetical protein
MEIRSVAVGLVIASLGLATAAPTDPTPIELPRVKCRSFPTETGAAVDTRDPATELGRWVIELEDQGWRVTDVDWEITQKPTGYPQAYTHICLTPR